jgi:hypothetical protein
MNATLCLARQDPARAGLVRAVLSGLGAGLFLRIAPDLGRRISELTVDNQPGGFIPFYLLLTGMAATFVLGANGWTRSSRLATGLPLSTRHVWMIRATSLAAVALLSIGALAITLGLSIDSDTSRITMNPVVALAAARSVATVLVLLFVYQLPQSGRDRIPITAPYVVYIIGASLLTVVISAAEITSIVGTLFLLTTAGVLGIYLYRRLPATFSVGPTIGESESPVWSMPDEREFERPEGTDSDRVEVEHHPAIALHWTIFRGLKTNVLTWFLIPIVLASATVATLEFFKGTNALLPLFFLVIYQLPLLQTALESMAPFDSLPISRRVLWAHCTGPVIGSLVVGVCIAGVIFVVNPTSFSHVTFKGCCITTPWDYMELASDGRVPTITSPWGENHTPTAHRLWKGRTVTLYDPFEAGPENSQRFVDFQLRRAVEAVYGVPLESESRQSGAVHRAGFDPDATRGRMSADRNRTAAVALMLLALFSTLLVLFTLMQYGSSVHRSIFKRTSIGFIIFVVVLVVAASVARMLGFTEVWYVGALISMGTRSLAHSLPGPTWFLWFFCVTLWFGAYLLLERVFCRIEFPRESRERRQ